MVHDVRFQNGGCRRWVGWDHWYGQPCETRPCKLSWRSNWKSGQMNSKQALNVFFAGPLQDLQVPFEEVEWVKDKDVKPRRWRVTWLKRRFTKTRDINSSANAVLRFFFPKRFRECDVDMPDLAPSPWGLRSGWSLETHSWGLPPSGSPRFTPQD